MSLILKQEWESTDNQSKSCFAYTDIYLYIIYLILSKSHGMSKHYRFAYRFIHKFVMAKRENDC